MLELSDLRKRYGDIEALRGASFTVEPGRMVGFLGPNGAGKTTLMRAIFGLVQPDTGVVLWNGKPVGPVDRLRFGYMPEQRGLYPRMKAHDHLVYIGRLHGMSPRGASEAADRWLAEFGLEERAGDAVEKLSHGNQQRVQLAAALVHQPDLLVLDEPFSGLDPLGAETMANVLRREAARGAAVMFSSHQLDVVEDLCEDVTIIHDGAVVMTGNVRGLRRQAPIRHLELEVPAGTDGVLEGLEGVVSARFDGVRHSVTLQADVDVRSVLATAERSADIEHFVYTTPSLSELFKEAVA